VRAAAGAFTVFSSLCAVFGVVFLARIARPLVRGYWVAEVKRIDSRSRTPPVPAIRRDDVRRAVISWTLCVVCGVLATLLAANA
jgi:hypothetical protein